MTTAIEVVNYAKSLANQGIGVNADGVYGTQCVDLPNYISYHYFGKWLWGNAIDLLDSAAANGYYVKYNAADDINPKAGDIIWWDKNPKDEREGDGSLRARANGHVGFVYKVTPTTVYYTEYNGRVLNGYFPNQIERSAIRLPKFIHVQKKIH